MIWTVAWARACQVASLATAQPVKLGLRSRSATRKGQGKIMLAGALFEAVLFFNLMTTLMSDSPMQSLKLFWSFFDDDLIHVCFFLLFFADFCKLC
jgi:hypothetical protein